MIAEATITGARFRYEADLVSVLHTSLSRLVFGASVTHEVETFSEVPAVHGVPDLASIRFDWDAVRRRKEAGVLALSTDIEVRAVQSLARSAKSAPDLALDMGVSREYIRRAVLPILRASRWIAEDEAGRISVSRHARPVGRKVVTVEAKLRDWHGALGQARRQQLSADVAYIALDAASIRAASDELRYVASRGIGIITVDAATSRSRIWARPAKRATSFESRVGKMLIAERCLAMHDRGEVHGQIHPVFGWTRPADLLEG